MVGVGPHVKYCGWVPLFGVDSVELIKNKSGVPSTRVQCHYINGGPDECLKEERDVVGVLHEHWVGSALEAGPGICTNILLSLLAGIREKYAAKHQA
jgi:hypothetical protein